MLEVRLRSGTVVAFDGRVIEVFAEHEPSRRFHIGQTGAPEYVHTADGGRTVTLENGAVTLSFAPEEAPTCERLIAAIGDARTAMHRSDVR